MGNNIPEIGKSYYFIDEGRLIEGQVVDVNLDLSVVTLETSEGKLHALFGDIKGEASSKLAKTNK
jgi:hypothetical protein